MGEEQERLELEEPFNVTVISEEEHKELLEEMLELA